MIKTEKGHIVVKEVYERSSRVESRVQSEIAKKIQDQRVFSDTLSIVRDQRGKRRKLEQPETAYIKGTLSYESDADVEFRCAAGASNLQELHYTGSRWVTSDASKMKFLSPAQSPYRFSISLDRFLDEQAREYGHGVLVEALRAGTDRRYSVSMAGSLKVLSESQGTPNFHLCCSNTVNSSSEESKQAYKRFDWVEVASGSGKVFRSFINLRVVN